MIMRFENEWKPIITSPIDGTPIQGWVKIEQEGIETRYEWYPKIRNIHGEIEAYHSSGWFPLNMIPWVTRTVTHWMFPPEGPSNNET